MIDIPREFPPARFNDLSKDEINERATRYIELYAEKGQMIAASVAVGINIVMLTDHINRNAELRDMLLVADQVRLQALHDKAFGLAMAGDTEMIRFLLRYKPERPQQATVLPGAMQGMIQILEQSRATAKIIEISMPDGVSSTKQFGIDTGEGNATNQ